MRRFSLVRKIHLVGLLALYFFILYQMGWGWTVKYCFTYGQIVVPGAELFIILPFLAGIFLSWARFYDAEMAIHSISTSDSKAEIISRWKYVMLQARQSLIFAVPPFFLLFILQILSVIFPQLQQDPFALPILCGVLLAFLFIGQPLLLRWILGLKPLPDGPLRQRLIDTSQRLSFRYREILLWDTHNSMATALLAGPMWFLRFVVLTDRLIDSMEPEEIEAVFAHEVGHVKHRHMVFYLVFLLSSLLAWITLWHVSLSNISPEGIKAFVETYLPWPGFWLSNAEWFFILPLLLILMVYIFLVFGFISRQCERQADLYACVSVSWNAFMSALDKVAWLNGINPRRPGLLASWRHGTIRQRLDFLEKACCLPQFRRRFQQETILLKWGVLIALGAGLLLLGPEQVWGVIGEM